MNKKEKALCAVECLKRDYPDGICSLESGNALQLLIATILSAQCTDARVNQVTPVLFSRYPDLDSLCQARVEDIEQIIRSCGFYHTKAKNILNMSLMLQNEYNGVVPDTIDELTKLPGVGRKTANLIIGDVYGKPAVVADTHCIRITNLLGLCDSRDPYKVEMQLKELLPPQESNDFCHRLVLHGRAVCIARRPNCVQCSMNSFCKYAMESLK